MAASDPLADALFIGPLLFLSLLRTWLHPGFRLDDWIIFCLTLLASVMAAYGAPQEIEQLGIYGVMILPHKN